MTGFRVAFGGAQSLFGLRPDIETLGKIVGGGLPVGAYGGRKEIMQHILPAGKVFQAGTLSGNPLATAAGAATLRLLEESRPTSDWIGPHVAARDRVATSSRERWRAAYDGEGGEHADALFHPGPIQGWRQASQSDTARFGRYFHAHGQVLDQGSEPLLAVVPRLDGRGRGRHAPLDFAGPASQPHQAQQPQSAQASHGQRLEPRGVGTSRLERDAHAEATHELSVLEAVGGVAREAVSGGPYGRQVAEQGPVVTFHHLFEVSPVSLHPGERVAFPWVRLALGAQRMKARQPGPQPQVAPCLSLCNRRVGSAWLRSVSGWPLGDRTWRAGGPAGGAATAA